MSEYAYDNAPPDDGSDDGGYEYMTDDPVAAHERIDGVVDYLQQRHAEGEEAKRDAGWEKFLTDYPDLMNEKTAEPYAAAIDARAEAAGNPDLADDPRFARQQYEQIIAEHGRPPEVDEANQRFLDMHEKQQNHGVRAWHNRVFGSKPSS